jgi:hypothetical protein
MKTLHNPNNEIRGSDFTHTHTHTHIYIGGFENSFLKSSTGLWSIYGSPG